MADYRGYVTAAGQQFEALAKQMHYPVKIGFIEIGDGTLPDNESPISRTSLVHKTKQFPAIVEQDPERPGEWIAKCHIPADDAINGQGYFIREMGCKLVDQGDGVLYAYRRISNDWKPLITEGEAKSFIYILRFIPSNGELIKPTINPSVVYVDKQEQERRFLQHSNETNPHDQYALIGNAPDDLNSLEKLAEAYKKLHKYGCPLIGELIEWPHQLMPHEIFKDIGMTFIPYIGQAFDKAKFPLLAMIHPSGVLPADMRGEHVVGVDNGRGVDPGRALMSSKPSTGISDFQGDGGLVQKNFFIDSESTIAAGSGFIAFGGKSVGATGLTVYHRVRVRDVAWNMAVRAG